jgi:hypothetical protein
MVRPAANKLLASTHNMLADSELHSLIDAKTLHPRQCGSHGVITLCGSAMQAAWPAVSSLDAACYMPIPIRHLLLLTQVHSMVQARTRQYDLLNSTI